MEYNVPQFIEEEAKILGPFTFRDFFILLGAFLTSAMFFFFFRLWLAIFFASITMGGAAALLLVRINGRPLYTIALAALRFFWLPRLYLWQKPAIKPEEMIRERPMREPSQYTPPPAPSPKRLTPEDIRKLAEKLDITYDA